MNTPTPRTDAATYPADCLGKTLVTNRDCPRELERELTALTAERDELHAQLHALTLICGTNDANKFETWIDRANASAERAEAEVIRLRTENSDLKATDTRSLLTGTLTHAGFCRIGEEQLDGVFISIDREQIKALPRFPMYERIELRVAAMKEDVK